MFALTELHNDSDRHLFSRASLHKVGETGQWELQPALGIKPAVGYENLTRINLVRRFRHTLDIHDAGKREIVQRQRESLRFQGCGSPFGIDTRPQYMRAPA